MSSVLRSIQEVGILVEDIFVTSLKGVGQHIPATFGKHFIDHLNV